MSFALGSDPPWGLVEWTMTGLSTAALSAFAFVWRLAARLDKAFDAIEWQKTEAAAVRQATDAAALRLGDRVAQLQDDHFRLRETTAALPTRADLRDMEERLGERIAALATRIDAVLDGRGG
jgi:hypothetical protein